MTYVNGVVWGQDSASGGWYQYANGQWQGPSSSPVDGSTPPPASAGLVFGVNGHDFGNPSVYSPENAEARCFSSFRRIIYTRIAWMLGTSRPADQLAVLDNLVCARGEVRLDHPSDVLYLYAGGQSAAANTAAQYAYTYAKRYAQSIPVWELGNELDGDRAHADVNTAQMRDMAAGVQQAAAETGVVLKTAINIMATCNDADPCDTNGDLWFLDTASGKQWIQFRHRHLSLLFTL